MSNRTMINAKVDPKDEFYTQVEDIENELRFYRPHFEDKIVYLNTDHPDYSNFYWHFKMLFEVYKLKKLVATFWDPEGKAFKTEYDGKEEVRTPLKGDGDFRSDECLAILEESDIVVTNPPFSLFREFVLTLVEYDKKFLVIGNNNAITYKEIFPLIKDNKIWLGNSSNTTMTFQVHEDYIVNEKSGYIDSEGRKFLKVSSISWFTNMDYPKRYEDLLLWNSYKGSEDFYPEYDNIKAINIDKVKFIPYDYEGVMGVPISFVSHWNPNQFEILGFDDDVERGDLTYLQKPNWDGPYGKGYVNGERKYGRLLIRNLNPVDEIEI